MLENQAYRPKRSMRVRNFLSGGIALLIFAACQRNSNTDTASPRPEEQIAGSWVLDEVDQGVIYSVTFHPDHRMTQLFSHYDSDGRGKERYGEWSLAGDTLMIEDLQGSYKLYIETLNDSTLVLNKGEEDMPLFFHRKPQ